ncbi:MAG TPA: hypothetical protein VGK79_17395 [Gaiellaceae bacterium]
MRFFLAILAAAAALTWVAAAAADDGYVPPPCADTDVATLAPAECTGQEPVPSIAADDGDLPSAASLAAKAAAVEAAMPSPADLPAYCRVHANVYFYTSTDWLRLGQRLQANQSPCADYWISIPPLAADKTAPRCLQDDLVRALGPHFHVMAELHFAGWNKWWSAPGRTPALAGAEFVRKWQECGYLQPGETWALNEMHSGIRRNVPGARANMIQFLDAARRASGTKGVAWVIGVGQQTANVSDYKPQLEEWFQDASFWTAMGADIDVWGQEAYPDMRYWGVDDTSRHDRTTNLDLYLEHPLLLAESGPEAASSAHDYLERTYVPLASAAWPYTSGFGDTNFSADQMERFVSEQTYAVKHFSLSRPQGAPDGRIAFAWAPNNSCDGKPCMDAKLFASSTLGILDRLASAIRESYERGGGSQMGACGAPGDHTWCNADIDGAAFNPLWSTFPDW